MLKRIASCLLMILLFAALVAAHGEPILGTVTAVGKDTVTIKDNKTGKPVIIMLEKNTKYLINKKAATLADLKVGSRVSIDAHNDEKMKMLSAEEIEIGAPAPAK